MMDIAESVAAFLGIKAEAMRKLADSEASELASELHELAANFEAKAAEIMNAAPPAGT